MFFSQRIELFFSVTQLKLIMPNEKRLTTDKLEYIAKLLIKCCDNKCTNYLNLDNK
jgi:hypothetical protein